MQIGRLRRLAGLFLIGYGVLVVLRILAHEAVSMGILGIVLGAAFLLPSRRNLPATPAYKAPLASPTRRVSSVHGSRRAWCVAGLGGTAIAGVLVYNIFARSGLGGPEWGLVLYGVALLAVAPLVDSGPRGTRVSALIGWSFPLLLVPLMLFALHGIISGPAGLQTGGLAQPAIRYTLVKPAAIGLTAFGTNVRVISDNMIVRGDQGALTLGVGLVCAGIYPAVMFLGVLGLHAWREGMQARRLAAYLTVGMIGLWIANLARIMILVKVGQVWGAVRLQQAHAHLGWIFFIAFMVTFWAFVLRRWERAPTPAPTV